MDSLTIVPYHPKLSNSRNCKRRSRFIEKHSSFFDDLEHDSRNMPKLLPSQAIREGHYWQPKDVVINQDGAESPQAFKCHSIDSQACIPSDHKSSDETDNDLPSLTQLLASNSTIKTPHKRLVQSQTINGLLDDETLSASDSSKLPGSYDETIVLDSVAGSEDGDDNHTACIPGTRQSDYHACNLDISPAASDHDDNHRNFGKIESIINSDDINSDYCYVGELGDEGDELEQRTSMIALDRGQNVSRSSQISKDVARLRSTSRHSKSAHTSTASATPGITPPTERLSLAQRIDANQECEIRKVIGKEDIDGVLHYLVAWSDTLMPLSSLEHAMELVDEFEVQLRTQCRSNDKLKGPIFKRGKRAAVEPDLLDGQQPKRSRCHPREPT